MGDVENRDLLEGIERQLGRNNDLIEDFRQFTQDLTSRFERAMRAVEQTMRDQGEAMTSLAGQVEAQKDAVLCVLDHLRGPHGEAG